VMQAYNTVISKVRISVECHLGDVTTHLKFVELKKEFELLSK